MSIGELPRTIDLSFLGAGKLPSGSPAVRSRLSFPYAIPGSLTVLDDPSEAAPAGHFVFRVLTPTDGDKRITWDAKSFLEIKDAEKMFNDLIAEGLVPYKVGLGGKASSDVMDEFDPFAEEVIFLPIVMVAAG